MDIVDDTWKILDTSDDTWKILDIADDTWMILDIAVDTWKIFHRLSGYCQHFHNWNIFHRLCIFHMEVFCHDYNDCVLCPSKSI